MLEADAKLTAGKVLQRIFRPTQKVSPDGKPVFGLYNGSDGDKDGDTDGGKDGNDVQKA